VGKIAHHTLGDGVFGNFVDLSAGAACCHAVINPENCVVEMERVIAEARRSNQPAYIAVPSDYALSPVVSADVKPIVPRSNPEALQKAMTIIAARIRASKSGAYIEIIGGKMDMPPALAFAHGQLKAMYGDTP